MRRLLLIPLLLGSTLLGGAAGATELTSGLARDEPIPEFHSRVVTGPLRNKSICFVCRNGARPVVMVFVRSTGPEVQRLLRNVDRIVDRHRGDGVRSFGVWPSEDPNQSDVSRVQTFGFEGRIRMPLVVTPEEVAARQNVHEDAAVTVVCYRERRSVERMALRESELDVDHLRDVLKRVLQFAENAAAE